MYLVLVVYDQNSRGQKIEYIFDHECGYNC